MIASHADICVIFQRRPEYHAGEGCRETYQDKMPVIRYHLHGYFFLLRFRGFRLKPLVA
jgi:hypothetical protein